MYTTDIAILKKNDGSAIFAGNYKSAIDILSNLSGNTIRQFDVKHVTGGNVSMDASEWLNSQTEKKENDVNTSTKYSLRRRSKTLHEGPWATGEKEIREFLNELKNEDWGKYFVEIRTAEGKTVSVKPEDFWGGDITSKEGLEKILRKGIIVPQLILKDPEETFIVRDKKTEKEDNMEVKLKVVIGDEVIFVGKRSEVQKYLKTATNEIQTKSWVHEDGLDNIPADEWLCDAVGPQAKIMIEGALANDEIVVFHKETDQPLIVSRDKGIVIDRLRGMTILHTGDYLVFDPRRNKVCNAQIWMKENYLEPKNADNEINHPSHYTQYKGIEVIQLTEQMMNNRGNAVKYIARAGFKGGKDEELKDLKKALWYIEREIQRITQEGDDAS